MFARRPRYIRTAAVFASAVGLTAVGLNKGFIPRGLQQIWKADQKILMRGMATATTIKLDVGLQPEYYVKGLGEESARVASELLQENHEKHHIFFNQGGFHVSLFPNICSSGVLTNIIVRTTLSTTSSPSSP